MWQSCQNDYSLLALIHIFLWSQYIQNYHECGWLAWTGVCCCWTISIAFPVPVPRTGVIVTLPLVFLRLLAAVLLLEVEIEWAWFFIPCFQFDFIFNSSNSLELLGFINIVWSYWWGYYQIIWFYLSVSIGLVYQVKFWRP